MENNNQTAPYKVYCSIRTGKREVGMIARIDLGNPVHNRNMLLDDQRNALIFSSPADVLNHMAKRGWRLITTAVEENVYIVYFMEKEVKSDDEIRQGLREGIPSKTSSSASFTFD